MKFQAVIKTLIVLFALVGLTFCFVFVAMQFGWLNVRGTINDRNASFFQNIGNPLAVPTQGNRATTLCKIHVLANRAPETAQNIQTVYEVTGNESLIADMFSRAQLRFVNTDIVARMRECARVSIPDTTPIAQTAYAWADSPEWEVLKSAFIRDQETIRRAAADAGIQPRILLGGVIGEQFRFFTGKRDSFKKYFEPLKILASLSKFSYGIAGLKPETVKSIDEHLINPNSAFYLGVSMENVITYPAGSDHDAVRFERITDTKDTYYSYLYVGLFMRQVIAQWQRAGYDISHRPDALSTLYNLGFNRSIPKSEPVAGGAPITVNDELYSFGELGDQFYYSGELIQEFPYE